MALSGGGERFINHFALFQADSSAKRKSWIFVSPESSLGGTLEVD